MPTTPFDDVLSGDEFDNVINGDDGLDVLSGLGGNDTLNGGNDEDELFGGDGDDTLNGGNDDDRLFGEDGDDTLNGDDGEDDLRGGDGNDELFGGNDDDVLRGGDGDDELFGGNGDDRLIGGEGADVLDGGSGFDTASYISSSAGIDVSMGEDFEENTPRSEGDGDTLINIEQVLGSDHDDTIRDIGFGDSVFGRGGDDTFVVNGSAEINGGAGYDRLVVEGFFGFGESDEGEVDFPDESPVTGVEELVISGGNAELFISLEQLQSFERVVFDETATSTSALTVFVGDAAVFDVSQLLPLIDILGDAADRPNVGLLGGDADQVFTGDDGANVFGAGGGDDRINAGAGDDELNGGSGDDDLRGDDGDDQLFGGSGDDSLRGGTGDDELFGQNDNDLLLGGRGDDQLDGGFGDDLLDGGSGADRINGGNGFDTITYENSNEGIEVSLSGAVLGQGGDAEGDTLSGIERIIGSDFDDTISGVGQGDVVEAGSGNDTVITDGTPDQTLDGGAGTDRLIVTSASDLRDLTLSGFEELEVRALDNSSTFVEANFGQFADEVITFSRLPAAVLQSALLTQDGEDVSFEFDTIGSTSAVLTVFSDPAGDDDAGFDLDISSEFFEIIVDGLNIGTFSVNAVGDQIEVGTGPIDGFNTAFSTGDLLLDGPEFEALFADGSVTIEVNFSNSVGFTPGGDALFVSLEVDNFVSLPGEATLRLHAGSETARDLSDLTLEGFDAEVHSIELIGDNDDERFTGSERDDFIVGNRGNDLLRGGDGDDTLIGGEDDDRLIGGEGADALDGGAGFDTVSYVDSDEGVVIDLTREVAGIGGTAEGDTLTGFEAVLGSNQGDTITVGNGVSVTARSGDDTIIVDGADDISIDTRTLSGGAGDDVLVVKAASNFSGDDLSMIEELRIEEDDITVIFTPEQLLAFERIVSQVDVTIAIALEDGQVFDPTQLAIEGSGNVNFGIAGFDGDDLIDLDGTGLQFAFGLGGDDTLLGSAEDDRLDGGAGDDDLRGRDGNDFFSGREGNDTLRGEDGDDVLLGGDGDDRLIGGAGADLLNGGDGFDTASYIGSSEGIEVDLSDQNALGIGGEAEGDRLTSIEGVLGSNFDDTIRGVGDGDVVNTRGGDDTIFVDNTGSPEITITGGTGTDRLVVTQGNILSLTLSGIEILDFREAAGKPTIDAAAFADLDQILLADPGDIIVSYEGAFDVTDFLANIAEDVAGANRLVFHARGVEDVTAVGSEVADFINGSDGNDDLRGGGENDTLRGEVGDDTLRGEEGDDRLFGGDDDDRLIGGDGADDLDGGGGFDTASYIGSAEGVTITLDGTAGTGGEAEGDTLSGIEAVLGSNFGDTLTSVAGAVINGRGGDDILIGSTGDHLIGGSGNDRLILSDGNNRIFDGGSGFDTFVVERNQNLTDESIVNIERLELSGTSGFLQVAFTADQISALSEIALDNAVVRISEAVDFDMSQILVTSFDGNDRFEITGNDQINAITGSTANDIINGGGGSDDLRGDDGNDVLNGGAGDDTLRGGQGNDTVNGGEGNDRLIGGRGDDEMTGGAGDDVFVFANSQSGDNTVTDLESTEVIEISGLAGIDTTTFLDDLLAQQAATPGGDVVITLDNGTITLDDVDFTLSADNFQFV